MNLKQLLGEHTNKDFFLYADTAATHEGERKYLKRMIETVADIPLDGIKFHITDPESYMIPDHPLYEDVCDWSFGFNEWDKIISNVRQEGLSVFGLANDVPSAEFLIDQEVTCIEIHASGLNDKFLLDALQDYNGTVLLGISGSKVSEIQEAISAIQKNPDSSQYLVYGFQNYPTDTAALDFNKMIKLRELFDLPIVYAGHAGTKSDYRFYLPLVARALGVKAFEKHLILDKNEKRVDWEAAFNEEDFIKLKDMLLKVGETFKSGSLELQEDEIKYRQYKKSIVAAEDISSGKELTKDMLAYKQPSSEGEQTSQDLEQTDFDRIIGMKTATDIEKNQPLTWGLLK